MRGQIILIIVLSLTFSLFSIFMLLAPIRDKLLRIKEMEDIYQAIANSEKGLEASLLDVFKRINLSLNIATQTFPNTICGGLNPNLQHGVCNQITYTPQGSPWTRDEKFRGETFVFLIFINDEIRIRFRSLSDGYSGRNIRTSFIGPSPTGD